MLVLLALLFYAALLGFIVFSIMWIVKKLFLKNAPKGKSGLYALSSFAIFLISLILFSSTADSDLDSANIKIENSNSQEEVTETPKQNVNEQQIATEQKATEEKATEEKAAQEKATKDVEKIEKETVKKKESSSSTPAGLIPVTLVKTIDGDTIKIKYEGKEQNVRYLLVDTPETSHPQLGKQPFGEQAKERNRALVNSGKLSIEFDVGQRTDKYGRLLAYVYVDGVNINEKLVEEGLARVAYVYPPNTRHLTKFEEAQKRAKAKRIGIWSIEDYATDSGFKGTVAAPKSSGGSTSAPKSTGSSNTGSSTTTKPQASAPSTNAAKEFFQNCTELRKKYPNGVASNHSAYQAKMDRDKDGFACER